MNVIRRHRASLPLILDNGMEKIGCYSRERRQRTSRVRRKPLPQEITGDPSVEMAQFPNCSGPDHSIDHVLPPSSEMRMDLLTPLRLPSPHDTSSRASQKASEPPGMT